MGGFENSGQKNNWNQSGQNDGQGACRGLRQTFIRGQLIHANRKRVKIEWTQDKGCRQLLQDIHKHHQGGAEQAAPEQGQVNTKEKP